MKCCLGLPLAVGQIRVAETSVAHLVSVVNAAGFEIEYHDILAAAVVDWFDDTSDCFELCSWVVLYCSLLP